MSEEVSSETARKAYDCLIDLSTRDIYEVWNVKWEKILDENHLNRVKKNHAVFFENR